MLELLVTPVPGSKLRQLKHSGALCFQEQQVYGSDLWLAHNLNACDSEWIAYKRRNDGLDPEIYIDTPSVINAVA